MAAKPTAYVLGQIEMRIMALAAFEVVPELRTGARQAVEDLQQERPAKAHEYIKCKIRETESLLEILRDDEAAMARWISSIIGI